MRDNGVIHAPAIATNGGAVAISELEMSQDSMRCSFAREEIDRQLRDIMEGIHDRGEQAGGCEDGVIDCVRGANIAGFEKVARVMVSQGV